MSNLTKKLWKVCDAVEVKEQTTTKEVSKMDKLTDMIKDNKKAAIFVGIVLLMVLGNWLGL